MAKSALQRVSTNKPQLALADELARIARRVQTSTLAFGAAIALLQPETGDFVCQARSGSMAPPLEMPLQKEGSFTGVCIQSGEGLHCEDSETDDRVDTGVIRALGVRSIIAVPIKHQETVIGVLATFSPVRGAFTDIEVSALKTAADHVAGLVQGDGFLSRPPIPQDTIVKPSTAETRLILSPTVQILRRTGLYLAPQAPKTTPKTTRVRPISLYLGARAGTLFLIGSIAVLLTVGVTAYLRPGKLKWRAARHHARAASKQPAAVSLQRAPIQSAASPPTSDQVIEERLAKTPIPPATSLETPIRPSASPRIQIGQSAKHAETEPQVNSPQASETSARIQIVQGGQHAKTEAQVKSPPVSEASPRIQIVQGAKHAKTEAQVESPQASEASPRIEIVQGAKHAKTVAHVASPHAATASPRIQIVQGAKHAKTEAQVKSPQASEASPRIQIVQGAKHAKTEAQVESPQASEALPTIASTGQPAVASTVPPPSLASISPKGGLSAIFGAAPDLPRQIHELQPPQLVRSVPAVSPEFARQRRIRSVVLVKATIAKDGTVAKAEFAGGLPIFRDSALDAVRHRRYKPAMLDGQPVEQQIEIQLDFHP